MTEERMKIIQEMSTEQRESRLQEIVEKFGITNPKQLTGDNPVPIDLNDSDWEELELLKELLGYSSPR